MGVRVSVGNAGGASVVVVIDEGRARVEVSMAESIGTMGPEAARALGRMLDVAGEVAGEHTRHLNPVRR